uniref:hypothetical protein n=1 Tax=Serratia proteamaculans TaxID=28151 RepID=UPI001F4BF546|nr:hypothetical protein [Serratia proteamaculans]
MTSWASRKEKSLVTPSASVKGRNLSTSSIITFETLPTCPLNILMPQSIKALANDCYANTGGVDVPARTQIALAIKSDECQW